MRAAALASGVAVALETKGTVREARGLASKTNKVSPAWANWMLIKPQRAGRVTGVDACLLDVLHDAAQVEIGAVIERVDVDLYCVIEEAVDQHRVSRRDLGGALNVGRQRRLVVDDLHATTAEHVGRAHEHGVADVVGDLLCLGKGTRQSMLGCGQVGLGKDLTEGTPLLGEVDRLRAGADNGDPRILQRLS